MKEQKVTSNGGKKMNELEIKNTLFENIKHIDEDEREYWLARELQIALDYKRWDKFILVINKAIEACKGSNYKILDHIAIT